MTSVTTLLIPVALLALAVPLTGCSDGSQMEELKNKLEEIKSRPRGRIEPPPEFEPIESFSYAAHRMRSPFTVTREEEEEEQERDTPEGEQVEPDRARSEEYLEQFAVETLQMVGTITRPNQPLEALVKDPDGTVNRVTEGDYMGKNYGKVTEVTNSKIEIREIVPDGEDGWVERPNTIRLDE
jgi:type IV pilus assembly protein PilP